MPRCATPSIPQSILIAVHIGQDFSPQADGETAGAVRIISTDAISEQRAES